MRESFSYIVSGAEAPRKPTSMFNQTAPPSLSHSQAHTANHSGISTSEHSRKPSSVDHTIDPGLLDKSLGGLEAERESLRLALKAPCTVEASPVVAAGETQASKRRGRPRHNTVCVDYRGMEPMRGVAGTDGGDLPRIPESMSGPSFTQSPEAPAAMQDKPAAQDVEPHASPPPPPRRVPGSRMHSRHSSVSSVAGRLRKMSDAPNDADLEALATEEDASKGSTSLDPGASQHLAPPSAAVRAKGSASKPRRAQRAAARAEPIEDRASLMSQVTERLEGLNLRSAGLRAAGPGARARRGSTYADAPENEAGPQLPPARTVVDWSFTTADKVATWFLDNIPGGVSMVSAPADAFGEPVAGRRPGEHSDGLSLTSCSSCSCSRCGSDSDESSSSESAADRAQAAHPPSALGAAIAAASKPVAAHPRTDAATSLRYGAPGRPIATHSASLAAVQMGLTLPQPLGLAAIGADTGGRATDAVAMSCPGRASGRVGLDARSAAAPAPSSDSEQASSDGERRARAQKFLILSKPGGRFVPIDMSRGVILPTVVPPELPPEVLAGGNSAQLMNVDASGSQHSLQLTASTALPHYSATDLGADSYVCQSPSWQSGSVPWAHAGPGMSFSSAGAFAASPAQLADHPSHVAMGAPLVSQFPIGDAPPGARGSPAPSLAGEAAAAHADADLRRLPAGTSYGSVVRPGSISGAASLASNLRAQRGLHRISYDVLRSQGPATHVGLSPLNRSSMASGAVTPGAGGYLFGASQLNRRQLGYAGLRGYIGGNSQQHAGGRLAGGLRGDDGRLLPGHHSPLGTGTLSGRGYSFVLSQGLGTGTMPREPTSGYFSPVLPGTLTAADEHHTRHWLDSIRRSPHQQWHGPAAPASASPQPGLQHQRPSPSSLAWSNLKDGGDQQQQQQQQQHRPNSATPACMATGEHQQGTHLPELLGREPGAGGGYEDGPAVASAERLFWSQGEVQSVQSHSSLGAGASMGHVPVVAKEEEIEEAPQPVELEVATYMVGGVSPGLRRAGDAPADDGDEDEEEASELVSLVTMDGTVSCYDPQRKVNHFVNLNAKDPVLGIWKAKMHREVSRPSPLAEALRDGHIAADCCFGRRLAAHTPATPTRRRVGLSHGSLHDAVRYAIYVEDSVQLLNGLDSGLRRRGLRPAAAIRRLRQTSSGMLGDRGAPDAPRRERVSPRGSRGNTLARHARAGLNSRLLETISWSGRGYHTVRGAARDPPARAPAEDEGSYPVPSDSDAANASFVSSAAAAAAAAGARKPSAGRLAAGEAAASEGARAKGGIANSDGAAAAASGNGSTGTSNAGTGA
ncbi:hypothetical protein IWQ57_002980, partial [Coemansia nantahalensis]